MPEEITPEQHANYQKHLADERALAKFIADHGGFRRFLSLLQSYCEDHVLELGRPLTDKVALNCWAAMGMIAEAAKKAGG